MKHVGIEIKFYNLDTFKKQIDVNFIDLDSNLVDYKVTSLIFCHVWRSIMATKMAVAFSVIFMAHVEKQLLHASSYSHFSGWTKFIDDIFSVWTLPETEINNFIDFANSFHTTIKFTLTNCHQNKLFSLTTEVFKGSRFIRFKHII